MTDVTLLVKPGRNELKIEVMNMWINRLTGDQGLPTDERLTRTNITFDGYRGKPGTWEVQPAGLLGPVRLVPSVQVVFSVHSLPSSQSLPLVSQLPGVQPPVPSHSSNSVQGSPSSQGSPLFLMVHRGL